MNGKNDYLAHRVFVYLRCLMEDCTLDFLSCLISHVLVCLSFYQVGSFDTILSALLPNMKNKKSDS